MKQSKRKIKKANIRRTTKKTNYRKIQRGGMLDSHDKTEINSFMQSLRLSPNEPVLIMFPYENIHMDITFPVKSLDQDINKNYHGLRNDELKTIPLEETNLDFPIISFFCSSSNIGFLLTEIILIEIKKYLYHYQILWANQYQEL